MRPGQYVFLCIAMAISYGWPVVGAAQDQKAWSMKRYHVQIHLAFDASANPGSISAEELQKQLHQDIRLHFYPLWNCEIVGHAGLSRRLLLDSLDDHEKLATFNGNDIDKHLFLTVRSTGLGWKLACREHDELTNIWSPVLTEEIKQDIVLAQSCLTLISQTFSPLAMVSLDPADTETVYLDFMGAELPRQSDEEPFVKPSTVFQVMMLRRQRAGSTAGQNLINIPWTYVVTEEPAEIAWKSRVFSGTSRPFALSNRAGIETIALPLKQFLPSTKVRFHTSHEASVGLAGYEVFAKGSDDKQFLPLAVTDHTGSVVVPRGKSPITLLALRTDSHVLAQVPIAPGTAETIDIPIADDVARLAVQAALTSFKELLVDTVARRSILIARTRDQLAKGKRPEAEKLFKQLDELPKRPMLSRQLEAIANNSAHKSENRIVQSKIDRLIAESREMLGNFLSNKELIELESDIRNASTNSEKVGATP